MSLRKIIIVGGLILIVLGAGKAGELISEILTYRVIFTGPRHGALQYILIRSPQIAILLASGIVSSMKPYIIERLVERISNRDANKALDSISE
jgi:hypothetical protein